MGERVLEREKKKLFSPQHLMKALLAAPARYSSSVLFSRRNTIFLPRASAFASMVDVPSAGAGGAGGGDRKRARRPRGGRGRTAGTGNGGGGIANGGLGGGAPGAALGLGGAPAHFSSAAVQAGKVGCSKRERDRGSGNSRACESVQSEIDLNGRNAWAASGKNKKRWPSNSLSLFSHARPCSSFDDGEPEEASALEFQARLGRINQRDSLCPACLKFASRGKKRLPSSGWRCRRCSTSLSSLTFSSPSLSPAHRRSPFPLPTPTPTNSKTSNNQIANALGAPPSSGVPRPPPPPLPQSSRQISSTTAAHLTSTLFEQLPISPLTKRALHEVLGYQTCTEVQARAVPPALQGKDLVCKAKTGTGKTLGFLIPAFEALLARPVGRGNKIGILIVSPTRELATQIAVEAEALSKFHSSFNGVLSVVGGYVFFSFLSFFLSQRLRARSDGAGEMEQSSLPLPFFFPLLLPSKKNKTKTTTEPT